MKRVPQVTVSPRTHPRSPCAGGIRGPWAAAFLLLTVSSLVCGACATPRSGPDPGGLEAGDNTIITEAELRNLTVSNAYDAVAQLRPLWLQSRGPRSNRLPTEIVVAQNSSYFGPLSSLRQFRVAEIREMRYLDGPQAGAFLSGLGSRHVEGAIVIRLR